MARRSVDTETGVAMPPVEESHMEADDDSSVHDSDTSSPAADRQPLRKSGQAVGRPLEFWGMAAVSLAVGVVLLPFSPCIRRCSIRNGIFMGGGLQLGVTGVAIFIFILATLDVHPAFALLPLPAVPAGIALVYVGARNWAAATATRGHADLAMALGVSLVLVIAIIATVLWYLFQALVGAM